MVAGRGYLAYKDSPVETEVSCCRVLVLWVVIWFEIECGCKREVVLDVIGKLCITFVPWESKWIA